MICTEDRSGPWEEEVDVDVLIGLETDNELTGGTTSGG
jgi:hypothetical protein